MAYLTSLGAEEQAPSCVPPKWVKAELIFQNVKGAAREDFSREVLTRLRVPLRFAASIRFPDFGNLRRVGKPQISHSCSFAKTHFCCYGNA